MKLIKYLFAFSLQLSCGVTYQEVEIVDCDKIIFGKWKVHKIVKPFGILSEPSDYIIWDFKNNEVLIEKHVIGYRIEDNCSKLILNFRPEKDISLKLKIQSRDSISLSMRPLHHESYYIGLVRID